MALTVFIGNNPITGVPYLIPLPLHRDDHFSSLVLPNKEAQYENPNNGRETI